MIKTLRLFFLIISGITIGACLYLLLYFPPEKEEKVVQKIDVKKIAEISAIKYTFDEDIQIKRPEFTIGPLALDQGGGSYKISFVARLSVDTSQAIVTGESIYFPGVIVQTSILKIHSVNESGGLNPFPQDSLLPKLSQQRLTQIRETVCQNIDIQEFRGALQDAVRVLVPHLTVEIGSNCTGG